MKIYTVEIFGEFKYVVDIEANSGREAEEIATSDLEDTNLDIEIIDVESY